MPAASGPQQADAAMTPPPSQGGTRRPASPTSIPFAKLPRPTNSLRKDVAALETALGMQDAHSAMWAIRNCFHHLAGQLDDWVADISVHAYTLESHHTSFFNARESMGKIKSHVVDVELSAKNKFASVDDEISKMKQDMEDALNKSHFEIRQHITKAQGGRFLEPCGGDDCHRSREARAFLLGHG